MVSFILCLLPALLATTSVQAQTATCQQFSGSADSCQPPAGTCTAETAKGGCITVAEENTLQGTKTTGLSRGCLNDFTGVIKSPVTVTLGNGKYVRINIAQCSTETCNSPVLDVPTGSTTVNGLQCPTCFSLNSDPCNSSVTPCTGEETYCIDFAGTVKKGTTVSALVGKGCATESTKDITAGTSLVSAVYTYNFTNATSKPAENTPATTKTTTTTKTPAATKTTTATKSPATTKPPATTKTPAATKTTTATKSPATTKPPATTKTTAATTSGASLALGKFSFALYLPGLTGLLLVKLLS